METAAQFLKRYPEEDDSDLAPFWRYLSAPAQDAGWKQLAQRMVGGVRIREYELQSQLWQGIPWSHRLSILLPPQWDREQLAFLFVTGSFEGGMSPEALTLFAQSISAPVAILYDVPNQPLFEGLSEDALVAYSFVQYLNTGDPTWPLLFPMVRSVLIAMQSLSEILGSGLRFRYVVSGASKRGWTTWLAGAADRRVAGIVPIVYNNLNIPAQMQRQVDSWDRHSDEISDYVESGLVDRIRTDEGRRVVEMVDPYSYRSLLEIPKLLVHGTNDRYWAQDAASLYFEDVPPPKHTLYVPNAGHSLLDRAEAWYAAAALFDTVRDGSCLPEIETAFSGHNWECYMRTRSDATPIAARAWLAVSESSDLRDSTWMPYPLVSEGDWLAFTTRIPRRGHLALFAELDFERGERRYSLSSSLLIAPSIPQRVHK